MPTYDELVIVAREADLRHGGARVRRFLRALGEGHEALRPTPERRAIRSCRPTRTSTRGFSSRA